MSAFPIAKARLIVSWRVASVLMTFLLWIPQAETVNGTQAPLKLVGSSTPLAKSASLMGLGNALEILRQTTHAVLVKSLWNSSAATLLKLVTRKAFLVIS